MNDLTSFKDGYKLSIVAEFSEGWFQLLLQPGRHTPFQRIGQLLKSPEAKGGMKTGTEKSRGKL